MRELSKGVTFAGPPERSYRDEDAVDELKRALNNIGTMDFINILINGFTAPQLSSSSPTDSTEE